MATLEVEEEIRDLKAEIEGYRQEYANASSEDKKDRRLLDATATRNDITALRQQLQQDSELILVPTNVPFSVEIENCTRPELGSSTCSPDKLIGVADALVEAMKLIEDELVKVTQGAQRVRPLMISRLARGGKTTILSMLFDELQRQGCRQIFITFNSSYNFQLRQGESQHDAILRLIATQLVDIGHNDPLNIQCDEKKLDEFIGELPFVLLIDELNALDTPVDRDAGSMLRRLFLDKKDRYLVFTTHVPISLEPCSSSKYMMSPEEPPSPRGCLTVPLYQCMEIDSLRNMSVQCEALTPAEVMLYGGIPSLIYSIKSMHEMTPSVRFYKKIKPRSCDPDLLKYFVASVVDGVRLPEIAMFDEFSFMPEEDKIRWPLCYIACILKAFKLNEATHAVCGYCDALSTHAQETESGKEWECVLNIAIVFRCLYQAYYGSESPFSIVPCGIEPSVICRTIPAELKTQSSIRDFIAHSRASGPCLLLLVPSSSKFPDFDGFVVYCPDETTETIFGYQAKTSRTYPKNACPDWMEEGLLLRGNSPTVGSLRRGWKYMSQQDVLSLLGYSLCPMYPASWPAYPRTDEFD